MSEHSHHNPHEPDPDEPKRWLDHPENVRKVIRWFFIGCGVVAALDILFWFHWPFHKHTSFKNENLWFEKFPFFYCLYGLIACVLLVLAAKGLRKLLMRDEDYYDG